MMSDEQLSLESKEAGAADLYGWHDRDDSE